MRLSLLNFACTLSALLAATSFSLILGFMLFEGKMLLM